MREIPLTQGKVMQCDDEDFDWFNQFKWHAVKDVNVWYARRKFYMKSGKKKSVRAHQFLMLGAKKIDHKDGNGLNNQKENLREATDTQNKQNQGKHSKTASSSYKGVCWREYVLIRKGVVYPYAHWLASITVNKVRLFLGHYESEDDAAIAYDYAAKIYFGEFARLNFPD